MLRIELEAQMGVALRGPGNILSQAVQPFAVLDQIEMVGRDLGGRALLGDGRRGRRDIGDRRRGGNGGQRTNCGAWVSRRLWTRSIGLPIILDFERLRERGELGIRLRLRWSCSLQ